METYVYAIYDKSLGGEDIWLDRKGEFGPLANARFIEDIDDANSMALSGGLTLSRIRIATC